MSFEKQKFKMFFTVKLTVGEYRIQEVEFDKYQGTKRRNTLCIPSICNADICKLYQVFNARFDRCKRRI